MDNSPQPNWLDPSMWGTGEVPQLATVESEEESNLPECLPPQPDVVFDASLEEEVQPPDEEPDDKKP